MNAKDNRPRASVHLIGLRVRMSVATLQRGNDGEGKEALAGQGREDREGQPEESQLRTASLGRAGSRAEPGQAPRGPREAVGASRQGHPEPPAQGLGMARRTPGHEYPSTDVRVHRFPEDFDALFPPPRGLVEHEWPPDQVKYDDESF